MRLMFRCTQAFVKTQSAAGLCEFCVDDGGQVVVATVDLAKRPSMGVAPAQIHVDDPRDEGGFSYLVPEPRGSVWQAAGALYIEHGRWAALGLPIVPAGPAAYELSAVYYTPDDAGNPSYAGRRYHGFHARVMERRDTTAYCDIWPAGGSNDPGVKPIGAWLDLAAPLDCDAGATLEPSAWPPIAQRLHPGSQVGAAGALYIDSERAGNLLLSIPKLPIYAAEPFAQVGVGDAFAAPTTEPSAWVDPAPRPPRSVFGLRLSGPGHGGDPRPVAERDAPIRRVRARGGAMTRQAPPRRAGPHGAELRRAFDPQPWDRARGPQAGLTLSVAGCRPSGAVMEILRVVAGGGHLALVDDLDGLYTLLRDAVTSGPMRVRRRLDLIGHAVTDNYLLRLGATTIDASDRHVIDVFGRIANEGLLPQLGIDALGLVGCRTAQSDAGRYTIERLHQLLKVKVNAPCDLVTADEFDANGFKGVMANLRRACPIFVWPEPDFIEGFGAKVLSVNQPPETERVYVVRDGEAGFSMAAVRRQLVEPSEGGWRKRGLLVKVRAHVVVASPSESPATTARSFEVLDDYRLVRVYPPGSDAAVVYRVADPAALKQLIEDGRSPIPVSLIEHAA